jgi:hypothetical protein
VERRDATRELQLAGEVPDDLRQADRLEHGWPGTQISSSTISIAPHGHSAAQIPHPLQ